MSITSLGKIEGQVTGVASSFGTSVFVCPCGCGTTGMLLVIDPEAADSKPLFIPIDGVDDFISQVQLCAARVRGKVQ